jgi:hypothetical protein
MAAGPIEQLPDPAQRPTIGAEEAFRLLGCGRTSGYELIRQGDFPGSGPPARPRDPHPDRASWPSSASARRSREPLGPHPVRIRSAEGREMLRNIE